MLALTRRFWPHALMAGFLLWLIAGLVASGEPAGCLAAVGVLWGSCGLSLACLVRAAE